MSPSDGDTRPFKDWGEFLNEWDDAHAAAEGFYDGFRQVTPSMGQPESKDNPHYYQFFFVIGQILKAVLVAAVGAKAAGAI